MILILRWLCKHDETSLANISHRDLTGFYQDFVGAAALLATRRSHRESARLHAPQNLALRRRHVRGGAAGLHFGEHDDVARSVARALRMEVRSDDVGGEVAAYVANRELSAETRKHIEALGLRYLIPLASNDLNNQVYVLYKLIN